jgi:hypothetical protein
MLWRFGAFVGNLKTSVLTATRNWTFPDRSGAVVIDGGSAALSRTVVTATGSKTFALSDAGTVHDCTNSSASTLTIPLNATVPFPVGTEIEVSRRTAQAVSIGAVGGVTVQSNGIATQTMPYGVDSGVQLTKVATDTWKLAVVPSSVAQFATVRQSAPVQAKVFRTAAHSFTGLGTTPFKLDVDTPAYQSPARSLSLNGRFTVTAESAGHYFVNALYSASSVSTICDVIMVLNRNGVPYERLGTTVNPAASYPLSVGGSTLVPLTSAGDFIEVTLAASTSGVNFTSVVGQLNFYCNMIRIA